MLQMKNQSYHLFLVFSFSMSFYVALATAQDRSVNSTSLFHVGVVLDLNSVVGKVAWRCISMAMADFYAVHRNYRSRLVLHLRNSRGDAFRAASAATELIKNVGVQAIIGPQTSQEADFLAKLGDKAHVPIISFSAISSSISSTQFPYFIRFAQNDSSQVKAIAAIVQAYCFKEVSLIHDDSHSGIAAIPYLIDALHDIDVKVLNRTALPFNARRAVIKDTLHKLEGTRSRVFVIHLSFSLGTRFFKEARKMKSKHVWIVTTGFTNLMSYMDPSLLSSMKDVIGVKTDVRSSRAHSKFIARWRRELREDQSNGENLGLNVYALWAYDATFSIAMAANKAGFGFSKMFSSRDQHSKVASNSTDLFNVGFSQTGFQVLKSIIATRFTGLSGEIELLIGQLQSSSFEIVNMTEKGHRIGYWTPRDGLFWSTVSSKGMVKSYFANANDLNVIQSRRVLKTNTSDKVLKIGVPVKTVFPEFINVTRTSTGYNVTGFAQEVFEKVMNNLSYKVPYEYFPFEDEDGVPKGDYNSLIYEVYLKNIDAVMGDTTILANRSKYVDFTQPYTISGIRMIVRIEKDDTKDLWWFMKPLTMELWLTTIAFFILKGLLVWIFEHGRNPEFQGKLSQQVGKTLTYSFSILVFAHKEKLESNYSRFIVNLWVFAVFILVSSYTANLTSILTVEKLRPVITNVDTLLKDRKLVGYQDGSFVFDYLKNLGFDESRLVRLSTIKDYANALSNGSVSAIFDEIPYINVFINKYCHQFAVVGPTYRTSGFGFVLRKESPMLLDISNAILNFIEGKEMDDIEKKWFGPGTCHDPLAANITSNKVNLNSFRSIYIILGMVSIVALILFFISFLYKILRDVTLRKIFEGRDLWWRALGIGLYFNKNEPVQDTGQPIRKTNCISGGQHNIEQSTAL